MRCAATKRSAWRPAWTTTSANRSRSPLAQGPPALCQDSDGRGRGGKAGRQRDLSGLLFKVAFFVTALPAVLRATLRLVWLDRRHDLRELTDELRAVAPWRPSYLANPRYLDGSVSRLLQVLKISGFTFGFAVVIRQSYRRHHAAAAFAFINSGKY